MEISKQDSPFFKKRLMTAGPTPVPDFVHSAMSSAVYYHRAKDFGEVVQRCRQKLPQVFGTQEEVLILSGSGTLAMEGSICNFINRGDQVIAIDSGKFGSRWAEQARIYGAEVIELFVERGQAVDVLKLEELLKKHPKTKAVLSHASETSTGVKHDVQAITKLCHQLEDCLSLVDGVTAVGVFSVPMDEWGIDVLIAGSQKGFMLPPGLSFASASKRAQERMEAVQNTRYYMDWRKEYKALKKNTGAFTSPVSLIAGLDVALDYYLNIGLENVYRKNNIMKKATRAGALGMGFSLLVEKEQQASEACTAIICDGSLVNKIRESYGLTISGGQDELKGKILRIGHMGYIDAWDVYSSLTVLGHESARKNEAIKVSQGLEAFWKVVSHDL